MRLRGADFCRREDAQTRVKAISLLALFFSIPIAISQDLQKQPELALQPTGDGCPCIEVLGLGPRQIASLAARRVSSEGWQEFFSVHVETGRNARQNPPVLGSYEIAGTTLRFRPRFVLTPGVRLLAVYRPAALGRLLGEPVRGAGSGAEIEGSFSIPRPAVMPTTIVESVYPSRRHLPENLLKFYLYFSAPMRRGDAYRSVRLENQAGGTVDLPFLELEEELWDASGRRFTLFFDPGRIKRGLRPREEAGPAIEEGKSYTLVIESTWKDAAGNPLKQTFRKRFSVGPPDDMQPRPEKWSIRHPRSGSRLPLVVEFPEPMDHAMLQRVISILDPNGTRVRGSISVDSEETRWIFTPEKAWEAGTHYLSIDSTLEDLAGNSIARPFEVDVFRPVERRVVPEFVRVPFRVD